MAYKSKKKKSRGKKLLRRLFVLGVLGLLLWTVFIGVRGAVRFTLALLNRPDYITSAIATEVQEQGGMQGEAILLREEIVVLADKPGTANLIQEQGSTVATGDNVLEIVDKSLLASVEAELRELDKQASQPSVDHSDEVAQLDTKITEKAGHLQELVTKYRTALASRSIDEYKDLYTNMNRSAKEISGLQQRRLQLLGTVNAIQEQRQALLARREQAIVSVKAPAPGRLFYSVDGLEHSASISSLGPGTFEAVKAAGAAKTVTQGGIAVAAGQPVFKLVTSDEVYLLVQLGKDNVHSADTWEGVTAQSDELNEKASFSASLVEHQTLGTDQLLLKTSEVLPGLHEERTVKLTVYPQGEVLCQVPASALLDDSSVLVLEGNIARKQTVTVRQQTGKNAVVTGLQPGTAVIKQPEGISDGEDVGPRLRK